MSEIIVIAEAHDDYRIATVLAQRILEKKFEWMESEEIRESVFEWRGLEENGTYSRWDKVDDIRKRFKHAGLKIPRYRRQAGVEPQKADFASTQVIIDLIQVLRKKSKRPICGVVFIRDLDDKPERKEGIKSARQEAQHTQPNLEIMIGAVYPKLEAWVLNGFIPLDSIEEQAVEEFQQKLTFDPCVEAYRLREKSKQEPQRIRNPKYVLKELTQGDKNREEQCWAETDLEVLQQRGGETGLTDYLGELEERLIPLVQRLCKN